MPAEDYEQRGDPNLSKVERRFKVFVKLKNNELNPFGLSNEWFVPNIILIITF